jgi:hypothetical protein
MAKEQVYFSHLQILALEKALNEMRENGLEFDTIVNIHNGGEDHASWIDIEPTQTKYLIQLGMKMGKYLGSLT